MNKTKYTASPETDFPLTTDTFSFSQAAYTEAIEHLAKLGSVNDCIVHGVEVSGSSVSAGAVVINGELLPFKAGSFKSTILVREIEATAKYRDGVERSTYFTRWAECGVGTGIAFSSLKRLKSLSALEKSIDTLENYTVPVGGIIMWSGQPSTIPAGWALCDGKNNTPNMSGRFVVGFAQTNGDYNVVNKKGGQDSVTLNKSQMPSHNHTGSVGESGKHYHETTFRSGDEHPDNVGSSNVGIVETYDDNDGWDIATSYAGAHTHSLQISATGGGQAHENRPAYYVVAYIMKL